jgi:hypothetical protein
MAGFFGNTALERQYTIEVYPTTHAREPVLKLGGYSYTYMQNPTANLDFSNPPTTVGIFANTTLNGQHGTSEGYPNTSVNRPLLEHESYSNTYTQTPPLNLDASNESYLPNTRPGNLLGDHFLPFGSGPTNDLNISDTFHGEYLLDANASYTNHVGPSITGFLSFVQSFEPQTHLGPNSYAIHFTGNLLQFQGPQLNTRKRQHDEELSIMQLTSTLQNQQPHLQMPKRRKRTAPRGTAKDWNAIENQLHYLVVKQGFTINKAREEICRDHGISTTDLT